MQSNIRVNSCMVHIEIHGNMAEDRFDVGIADMGTVLVFVDILLMIENKFLLFFDKEKRFDEVYLALSTVNSVVPPFLAHFSNKRQHQTTKLRQSSLMLHQPMQQYMTNHMKHVYYL